MKLTAKHHRKALIFRDKEAGKEVLISGAQWEQRGWGRNG
jgi:hypothetical protein